MLTMEQKLLRKIKKTAFKPNEVLGWLLVLMLCLSQVTIASDDESNRDKLIELLRSVGMSDKLDASVEITSTDVGTLSITDKGKFFYQYAIMTPEVSCDAELIVDPEFSVAKTAHNFVIVTHGWVDKGSDDWPADIAEAMMSSTDPNQWVCGYFDWKGGAAVVNPLDAAKYGRDIAGPRLAKAILEIDSKPEHVHLIAHSAGAWAIDAAAKMIARKTAADIHLTFLDAYVPPKWPNEYLADIEVGDSAKIWADHYYTKDITLLSTQRDLSNVHNVDISGIDVGLHSHEFPYRWYYATIAGDYRAKDPEHGRDVITDHKGIAYGAARGREFGLQNWNKSIGLDRIAKAVKLKKPPKNKKK